METLKFIQERNRMCKSFRGRCDNCPAGNNDCCYIFGWKEELITIVENWSKEHPGKTRQDVFFEQYPETICKNGVIAICPATIYRSQRGDNKNCKNSSKGCENCRREFWMQEVK